jgi:hypothetical protein
MTACAGAYEVGRGVWSVVDAGAAARAAMKVWWSVERGKVMLCAHS